MYHLARSARPGEFLSSKWESCQFFRQSQSSSGDRSFVFGQCRGARGVSPSLRCSVPNGVLQPKPGTDTRAASPDALGILGREGGNIASIYENLSQKAPAVRKTIEEYLADVVPGISGVDVKSLGPKQTLEFRQKVVGADPWR